MSTWRDIERHATENGFIPKDIYSENAKLFRVCPLPDEKRAEAENEIWRVYLSAAKKKKGGRNLYTEMFRYEWYEGRKRTGFWGNIEDAVKAIKHLENPRICIFSAGSGRDLLKVGLAAGVFTSSAPHGIRGTYREIHLDYLRLAKPGARFITTEFSDGNYKEMENSIADLEKKRLILPGMVDLARWDFRVKAPVASDTQDVVVFSLTGNYAHADEQPLILREIARCVKKEGLMITSTISSSFDFIKSKRPLYRLNFIIKTPLGWPMGLTFMKWQVNWAKMAGNMNRLGFWANTSAETWARHLEPAGMETVRIYDPCRLVPVEVLVSRKKRSSYSQ
ncbi:MAG: class I SAM-dependent methyltransferase [Deltaproteobacteria bacterium]|nr:class I SAM-dependent methyltransferase [Deltaproteobacteria bacterium]